jgi:hypothetical protein
MGLIVGEKSAIAAAPEGARQTVDFGPRTECEVLDANRDRVRAPISPLGR